MNLQTVINSRVGIGLALAVGGLTPRSLGIRLVSAGAWALAVRKHTPMVQAVRLNQWVASGKELDSAQLDQAVRDTFRSTGHCLFDFYHNLSNPPALERMTTIDDRIQRLTENSQSRRQGMVVVATHLGGFELAMLAVTRSGMRAFILSFPNPGGGYRWQNTIRRKWGVEIEPASTGSLRKAIQRLKDGGTVATGIDRPVPNTRYRPAFFGHPAELPVHHIQMALSAQAPVVVVASLPAKKGYFVTASDPIEMEPFPDRRTELVHNAERVLAVAEGYIRQAPQHWSMFYPVWPDLLAELPAT